jgi:hypothetical protein
LIAAGNAGSKGFEARRRGMSPHPGPRLVGFVESP